MSAFVVADDTINIILAGMQATKGRRLALDTPETPDFFEFPSEGPDEAAEVWGKRLRSLNEAAANYRYSHDERMMPEQPFQYVSIIAPSWVRVAKALNCFLYQCSEGNGPDKAIFKALERWRDDVCRSIVFGLPEYQEAPWD